MEMTVRGYIWYYSWMNIIMVETPGHNARNLLMKQIQLRFRCRSEQQN